MYPTVAIAEKCLAIFLSKRSEAPKPFSAEDLNEPFGIAISIPTEKTDRCADAAIDAREHKRKNKIFMVLVSPIKRADQFTSKFCFRLRAGFESVALSDGTNTKILFFAT